MIRSSRIGRDFAVLTTFVGLAALAAGCSTGVGDDRAAGTATEQITVFAASSLTGPFSDIGALLEARHPGSKVRFSFAGSAELAAQLDQGAEADIFAAADSSTMTAAVDANRVAGHPTTFATNSMAIAVPPDNPAGIGRFADLARPGVRLVLCLPTVPCGAATQRVERNTGVTLRPVSEESSVTDVVTKVIAREADAGVVYVSDIKRAGNRLTGIGIPSRDNTTNRYQIATLTGGPARGLAGEFRDLVVSDDGQRILRAAGFGSP